MAHQWPTEMYDQTKKTLQKDTTTQQQSTRS